MLNLGNNKHTGTYTLIKSKQLRGQGMFMLYMSIIKATLPDLFIVSCIFLQAQHCLYTNMLYAAQPTSEIDSQSIRCACV